MAPDDTGGKILLVKEKKKDTWKLPGLSLCYVDTISVAQITGSCIIPHHLFRKVSSWHILNIF